MKKTLTAIVLLTAMAYAMVYSSDLKVNWTYNGSSNDTAGFSIYYGPTSKNYTNFQRTGFVTNTVISNLPPNTTFFLSGTAVGFDNLESDLGNEAQLTTGPAITPTNGLPSVVKDFVITKVVQTIY